MSRREHPGRSERRSMGIRQLLLTRWEERKKHENGYIKKELPEEISIKFFETKVPDVDFREEMSNASVLWCPLQLHVDFFSQKETYGSSKISGNVGDAIKFGVPAIFPASYKNAYSFIFTEREDVEKQIIDLTNFSEDFSLNFNRRTIAGQLEKVLLSL